MRIIAVCLLVIAGLAGCASPDAPPADPDPAAPTQPTTSSQPTTSPDPDPATPETPNRAPTARITASVSTGPAPLAVTFGIAGDDEDGDALAWTLDLDGDGVSDAEGSVPDSFNHTFDVGRHMVNLTVSDGNQSTGDSITIEATAVAADEALVFSGDVEESCTTTCESCVPVVGCGGPPGAVGCASWLTSDPGGDCIWFALPDETAGRPFVLTSTSGDPDVEFMTDCDPSKDPEGLATELSSGDNYYAASGPESGNVPTGSLCAVAWEFNDGPSTITLTIA